MISKKGASAQIPIEEHCHFRWKQTQGSGHSARQVSLMLGTHFWIATYHNQNLHQKTVASKARSNSNVQTCIDRPRQGGALLALTSIKRCLWAICHWKSSSTVLLTNHWQLSDGLSKICPKSDFNQSWGWGLKTTHCLIQFSALFSVLNYKSSVFDFLRSVICMSVWWAIMEHRAKSVQRENISTAFYLHCKKKLLQQRILVYLVWSWYSGESSTQKSGFKFARFGYSHTTSTVFK